MNVKINYLIIGSGIAGLNFALNAAEKGKVLIVTKKETAETSTNYAQGGVAAVLAQTDNAKKHMQDTLIAGSFHNNKKVTEFMIHHSKEAIYKLIEKGVPFATSSNGELLLTREGGHTERRIAFVGDYTGKEIEKTLVNKTKKHPNITIWEHATAMKLLTSTQKKGKKKICHGAHILKKYSKTAQSTHKKNIRTYAIKTVYAENTILATGGLGRIYKYTTNPEISTGDGIKLGFEAGCHFQDMEFIQFHPTALNIEGAPKFLISEAVRGEGAFLKNARKERFMHRYHEMAELAPRDIVARAIFEEEKKGPVYLDITHKDAKQTKIRFPQIYQKLLKYGVDLTKNLIPISPAAHYSCGGIKVNLRGETNVKNLYAFGEVACTGVHGANRLASNSLLEALVFSEQILKISRKISKQSMEKMPHYNKPQCRELNFPQKKHLENAKKNIQNLMWEKVGIIRTSQGLKDALKMLKKIQKNHEKNILSIKNSLNITHPLIHEVESILCAATLVTKSALKRKKSLGSHMIKKITKTETHSRTSSSTRQKKYMKSSISFIFPFKKNILRNL
ncbi:L-aspartate oxidase [Candidatus Peregrinibacteria bacterium]|nr:L-aspartate oxidase [Candidatus Peregrinibacteria bacterium]